MAPTSEGAPTAYRRYAALDGLRGLAALVVVVHHVLLITPPLDGQDGDVPLWAWSLTHTPLHLLWAGDEAVVLFFVLSGFVLTLPFDREGRPSWLAYYPRRVVRLYLPALVSLGFSLLTMLLVTRRHVEDSSAWLDAHVLPITLSDVGHDAALLAGTGWYDSPLWSLQWEVAFSLLLPVYLLGRRFRHLAWPLAAVAALLSVVGAQVQVDALHHLPVFAVGVFMALGRAQLADLGRRVRGAWWWVLDVAAVLLVTGAWTVDLPGTGEGLLPIVGSALTIFLFLEQRGAVRFGSCRPVHWVGVRSFSLYLVHEPIVVAVANALDSSDPRIVLAVSLPLSLLVAALFYRAVERPSHRLANALGRRLGDRPRPVVREEARAGADVRREAEAG
ncbi:acyltransferase family protein [Geodermatophilus sp. SYSU D01106]